jgi:peptide/nickel transport system substrate-binding protein
MSDGKRPLGLTRRRVMRAAGVGAAGLAAAATLACGGKQQGSTPSGVATGGASPAAGAAVARTPKRGGTFLGVVGVDVPHLDVHTGRWPIGNLAGLFHAQLLQFKPDPTDRNKYEIVPYMVATLPEQPDDVTYVFRLRPNVHFHRIAPVNGRQVTAEDVVWSLGRVGAAGVTPPDNAYFTVRTRYNTIDKMEVVDPLTVRLTLKAPLAPFLAYIADMHPTIAPKEMGAKDLQDNRIGAGPFLFTDWQRDVSSTFKRNPEFFIADRPLLDEVRITVIKDEPARWAAFKAGQIHAVPVPTNLVAEAEKDKTATVVSYGITDPLYLALNARPDAKPLDDVRVRRAVSVAINQQEMIDKAFQGRAKPSGIIPWSMGDWAVLPDKLPYYKHDPTEARRMLAAAGVEGAKITFITTKGYAPEDDSAALAIAQLKAAGFEVQPQQFEYSVWLDRISNNQFGAYTVWASPQVDPDGIFQAFVTSANTRNYGTPALDEKIARQRRMLDRAERLKLVHEIQVDIADQAWRIGLPNWFQYQATAPFVREYDPAPVWYATTRWMWNTWLDK